MREATSLVVVRDIIEKGGKIKAYDPKASDEFKKTIEDVQKEHKEYFL